MLTDMAHGARRRGITAVMASTMAMALAGCGGGDGSSGGGTAANTAPAFSSAATASVVENATGVAYQATASDAQGNAITYSISGGSDASAFTITSGGALSFITAPNYDLAADANGDNVYAVTLQASDGRLSSTLPVSITVTNDREGIRVERVASGLDGAVAIASADFVSDLLVAYGNGSITRIDGSSGTGSPYLNITSGRGQVSLIGMTLAKGRGASTALYVLMTVDGEAWVGCRGCQSSMIWGKLADVTEGTALAIGTGPDGAAYLAVGDPSGSLAQDTTTGDRHGKIYRYTPHPDPYAGASLPEDLFLKELVGVGLRAPAGITAFPGGFLAVSDRGETAFDEISLTTALKDVNFGWPFFEGTQERRAGGAGLAGLVKPALVVPIGTQKRQSRGIVGGIAYGNGIAGIRNHYVFADKDGRIWSIPLSKFSANGTLQADALELRDEDFTPASGKIDHPVSMATDSTGTLYILDSDGELFRVTDANSSIVIINVGP